MWGSVTWWAHSRSPRRAKGSPSFGKRLGAFCFFASGYGAFGCDSVVARSEAVNQTSKPQM